MDTVIDIINEFLNHRDVYKVGKKVNVIEPMDEYWRECVSLFLAAVVYYIKENHTSEDELGYLAVLNFTNKARCMNFQELTALFSNKSSSSEAYKYYTAFWNKSGKTVVAVILTAHIKIKGMYFDKHRIAEFERVFDI